MFQKLNLVRILFIISFLVIAPIAASVAQIGAPLTTRKEVSIIDSQNGSATIDEIKLPPPKIEGSFYISDDWKTGTVKLTSGMTINNCGLKFDLENNLLEINIDNVIKVAYPEQFMEFQWYDLAKYDTVKFVNANIFFFDETEEPGGVFEIVSEGDYSFFVKHYADLLAPTYAPTVAMGNQDYKVIKKTGFYVERNGKVTKIKNAKVLYSIFGENADKVKAYAKDNKLKAKSKEDLEVLFEYGNSLKYN